MDRKDKKQEKGHQRNTWSRKKKVGTFFFVTAILIICSLSLMYFIDRDDNSDSFIASKSENDNKDKYIEIRESTKNISDRAQRLSSSGKTEEALEIYENAIENTDDVYTKSFLLLEKASLYSNKNMPDDALDAAKKAYDLNENSVSATSYLANHYDRLGNSQLAIEYYNKTIDLLNLENPRDYDEINYCINRIELLNS